MEAVVHKNVRCDGCGKFPLVGIRYKCTECCNFDFCEQCEATVEHSHNFIKIKKPIEGCPWKVGMRNSPEGERRGGWGGWKGHHGHKRNWAVFGLSAKRAFKLSKCLGGDPEIYREFIEKNPDMNFHELKDLYIKENNVKIIPKELT